MRVLVLPQKISVANLSKTFNKSTRENSTIVHALKDVNISIDEREFVSILGPSGCGKTTFLRILAGLVAYDAGQVLVNGKPVTKPCPDRAIVFQTFNLFPWRTVMQNVEFGLELHGIPKNDRRKQCQRYIKLVGLEGFENLYPTELSGGMQQRVGLARALSIDPEILLMDEPFASVDMQTRELLQDELLRIWHATAKTVVFVTHSIDEAVYLSDRVIVFRARPGSVLGEFRVDLPKPRYEHDVKSLPEFLNLRTKGRTMLKDSTIEDSGLTQGVT